MTTNALRVQNKKELVPELEAVFRAKPSQRWLDLLEDAGIPCAPIHDFRQVMEQPQTHAIGILQNIPEVDLTVVGLPMSFDGTRPSIRHRAPEMGERNAEFSS